MHIRHVYLLFAVLGTVIPLTPFVPWFLEFGVDLPRFVRAMFANPVTSLFSWDLILSACVVFIYSIRTTQRGVRWAWLAIPATCCVGVSLGLPLVLYLEARHEDRTAAQ